MKKKIQNVLSFLVLPALMLFLLWNGLFAGSYYYYETFGNASGTLDTNGWMLTYDMSREFWVSNTYNTEDAAQKFTITNQPANQRLLLYGDPNANPAYDQWYTGAGAIFRPVSNAQLGKQTFSASAEEPFGYQFVRYTTFVHRDAGPTYTPDNTGNNDDNYGKGLLEFWMVEDNGAYKYGDSFDNFVFFFDKAFNHNNVNSRTNNVWGYFDQYERDYSVNSAWTNLTDLDGVAQNPNLFRKQYSYPPNCTNTDELGIKMVHDGSRITIYVNLDPLGNSGGSVSNSWCRFAQVPVAWTNNLVAYFAAESPTPEGNNGGGANVYTYTYTEIGNFLMRTVSSNVTAQIYPTNVVTGSLVNFLIVLTNIMGSTNDSGIAEITVKKPSAFVSNWILSNVVVTNQYGVLSATNTNFNPSTGKFSLSTNSSGELVIRFRAASASDHQVVTNAVSYVSLSFSLWTPTNANSSGDAFEVYADCVKHYDTAQDIVFDGSAGIKYATTGRKKASSAYTGSLLVKTFGQPGADAWVNVSAVPYYQGQASATFTYKIDTGRNTNSPDISSLAIVIPDAGFTVISNFNSKILGPSAASNMYFTNYIASLGISNCVYVNYAGANKSVAGINGSDKLNFDVYGTAVLPLNVKTSNYQWKSYVNSSAFIAGTSWQMTTNTNMNNQNITLIARSPALAGNITPYSVSINTTVESNAISGATYSIVNEGQLGNDLYRTMVVVPPEFTNITAVRSSWLGANTNAATFDLFWTNLQSPSNLVLLVNYTNVSTNFRLLAGSNDVLTFNTIHRITDLDTNLIYKNWTLYGDNANTEGFMAGTENLPLLWGIWITPPMAVGQNQVLNPVIYTSASTDTVTNVIWNTSPLGVNIKMSKIVLPVWFTNVVSVTSTHISNTNQNIVVTNMNGTNVVYLYYLGTNGTTDGYGLLKSVNENPTNPDYDKVVIRAMDAIDWNSFTNTNYQLTNLLIQTVVFKTNADTSDTNFYSNCTTGVYSVTNSVAIQYPPVSAAYQITTNVIDSTTITNTLYYTLSNTGDYGNRIRKAVITIDAAAVSNIVSANSSLLGDISGGIASNVITVDYAAGSQILWGTSGDLITFVLVSKIVGTKYGPFDLNPLVMNDRETVTVTNVMPGGSGTLLFDIPKPKGAAGIYPNMMYAGTNESQALMAVVSNMGQGTDKFQKVQIVFPAAFSNAVVQASSQWLGKNSVSDPTYLVLTPTNLFVIYTNSMIPAGSNDVITLTTSYSNLSVGSTNGWWIGAFNGYKVLAVDYYEQLTNAILGDTNTYFTEMPTANIVPNGALTTDLSNTFTMTVRNGTNALNRSIQNVKVDIPYPYQASGMTVTYNSGKGFTSIVSNNSIYLNYGTNFIGNAYSSFDISANKNYIVYPTNVDWTASVYYNGESDGYKGITAVGTNSVTVTIALPNSQVYAYVSPQTISKDVTRNDFSMTVSNFGVFGNNIQIVEIIPPYTNNYTNIFTNISSLSNTLGGALSYTNGVILVRYYASNTNLPSNRKDVIFFTGFDNQNLPGFSGQWTVYAGNTTNTNSLIQAQVLLSGDLDFQVIQPGYRSDYRVSPNTVDTSLYQHTFSVLANNSGSAGNDVRVLRMFLPSPYLTNGIIVNSVLATSNFLTNYNGTNAVEIVYNSNVFVTGTNDTVTVTLSNSLSLGDTNIWIHLAANYYSSAQTYLDSLVQVGTNLIQFQMPQTAVEAKILTNEIYTLHKCFGIAYRFINKGQGSNKPVRAWITVPAMFTNAYGTVQYSSKVTNTNWTGNVLRLEYANFNSGDTDVVVFGFTNTVTNDYAESNVYFDAKFYNGEYTNTASSTGTYDLYLNVVTPPSASVSPLTALSTDYTNNITVYYKNNTSGVLPTMALRIDLPSSYTNILSAVSSNGTAFISNMSVYVTNYNGGSGLAKNAVDWVSISVRDSISKGYVSNVVWQLYADNGTGLGKARETISGNLVQNFIMPEPNLEAYLNTSWFYVCTNASVNTTNNMQITLINHGADANSVSVVKIVLPVPPVSPHPFTNVIASSIASTLLTNIAASVKVYSNEMYVYYTNELPNGLQSSQTDVISFDVWYLVLDSGTYPVSIYGNNGSQSGYVQASNAAPTTTLLSLNLPQQKSEMYLSVNPVVYTLDTNIVLGYKVNNNSYSFDTKCVFIPFDTNIVTNVLRIASAWLSNTNITPVFTNIGSVKGLLVDYSAKPLPKRQFDDLSLYVGYQLTAATNMDMSGLVRYAGSVFYETTLVPAGSSSVLTVAVADFGRIYGTVLPGYLNSGVKVVLTNSDTIVTNKYGTNVTATADTNGYFLLDYVPQGTYDIVLNVSKYKDIRLSNFTVVSNTITNAGTNMMRHSPISARSTQAEDLLSQSDSATKITVYPNTLTRDVSIDIWLTNITDGDMKAWIQGSTNLATPANLGALFMYWFDMRDSVGNQLTELEMTNDSLLVLHYDVSNVIAQGWDESKLAIYYWRSMTKEWVRVGGTVDQTAKTVTAKVGYLHQYYAVFGEAGAAKSVTPGFKSVRTDPKVFTPRSSNPAYRNMKITISFDGAVDKYTVKIYDLRGSLVKSFERSGTYAQGEVYWDGKDDQGYDVKGGVYIYRITAGANAYSGTIIIAR